MTDESQIKTFVFPKTVYLEKLGEVNGLNFDLGFVTKSEGSVALVMFKYFDSDHNKLLQRRLVKLHCDNVARYMAVFDKKNNVRYFKNSFLTGECVFITHPYSELSAEYDIASVEADVYLVCSEKMEELHYDMKLEVFTTSIDIIPPFKGRWLHFEGHDLHTHHRQIFSGKNSNFFATDYLKVNDEGDFNTGSGENNSDYFSFGAKVYCVADGTVVSVKDKFSDNSKIGVIGKFDQAYPGGNTVIIKHDEKLYSYLAHFKKGSIRVKKDQKVKQGDVLGLCGNSGASSAPHIHFHMMKSGDRNILKVHGVPTVFSRFHRYTGKELHLMKDCGSYPGEFIEP